MGCVIRYYRRESSIAAAETDGAALRLERAGWERIEEAEFMEAWKKRGAAQLREMHPPRERAVGEERPWWY